MKLTITTNDGEVVGVVENLEQYDLSKILPRADLLLEIQTKLDDYRRYELEVANPMVTGDDVREGVKLLKQGRKSTDENG